MTKDQIIEAIQRTTRENGGVPLGIARFTAATGISIHDCVGVYWAKWSDALVEAGFPPNELNPAYNEDRMMQQYAELAVELGRLPTKADMQMKRRRDPAFAAWETFRRKFGSTAELRRKVADFCHTNPNIVEYAALYDESPLSNSVDSSEPALSNKISGYVYLLRHGKRHEYKIGRTTNVLRREGQVAIELPEKVQPVHVISTDDPSGIEAYWHNRFAAKRKNGEWFELDRNDVAAFKRRRFM